MFRSSSTSALQDVQEQQHTSAAQNVQEQQHASAAQNVQEQQHISIAGCSGGAAYISSTGCRGGAKSGMSWPRTLVRRRRNVSTAKVPPTRRARYAGTPLELDKVQILPGDGGEVDGGLGHLRRTARKGAVLETGRQRKHSRKALSWRWDGSRSTAERRCLRWTAPLDPWWTWLSPRSLPPRGCSWPGCVGTAAASSCSCCSVSYCYGPGTMPGHSTAIHCASAAVLQKTDAFSCGVACSSSRRGDLSACKRDAEAS